MRRRARWSAVLPAIGLAFGAALSVAPAAADLPDFDATPFECAGHEVLTNACARISETRLGADGTGMRRTVLYADIDIAPLDDLASGATRLSAFFVTITTPVALREGDLLCADFTRAEVTIRPDDRRLAAGVVERARIALAARFAARGEICGSYVDAGLNWFWQPADGAGEEETLDLLPADVGAALTLRKTAL